MTTIMTRIIRHRHLLTLVTPSLTPSLTATTTTTNTTTKPSRHRHHAIPCSVTSLTATTTVVTLISVRRRRLLKMSRDDYCDDSNSSSSYNDSLTYMVEEYDEDHWFEFLIKVVVPTLFGLIVLMGFIGNMVVVLVVSLYHRARTATSLLMLNLAVADIVFIVVCVPTTAARYALPVWPLGPVWCKVRV